MNKPTPWNPEVQFRIHKSSPIIPILSLIIPIHRIDTNFFNSSDNNIIKSNINDNDNYSRINKDNSNTNDNNNKNNIDNNNNINNDNKNKNN